jgi:hypothetical protein
MEVGVVGRSTFGLLEGCLPPGKEIKTIKMDQVKIMIKFKFH